MRKSYYHKQREILFSNPNGHFPKKIIPFGLQGNFYQDEEPRNLESMISFNLSKNLLASRFF
jgi:hypothetical protein